MTNENKNLGNDDFKTQDNFSTENHVFHDEKKEHGKDDFERQDAFDNKPKTSVKNIDIGKLVKFGGILALIIGLVIFGVYLKLQKNKESRVESGVESAVAKPVTGMDGSNFNGMDRFGFGNPQPIPTATTPDPVNPTEKSPEQLEMEHQIS